MAGAVYLLEDGGRRRVDKPGQQLAPSAVLELHQGDDYVSRGAYKLITALDHFRLDPAGLVCLDAGASTGGFTDVLLRRGAARVYAVDVGTHQLHERLRADPRVVSLERTNLRTAPPELLGEAVDLAVADLSFISLTLVLPAIVRFCATPARVVALIKPQFEVGRGGTVKGVVRDEALRRAAVEGVVAFAEAELGLVTVGVTPSAVTGPKGNQEYLALWDRGGGRGGGWGDGDEGEGA